MHESQLARYREQRFLENFIEFGALHRARVAYECLERFKRVSPEEKTTRASLALEMVQTYLNAFEDVGIWLTILPKWLRVEGTLVHLLSRAGKKKSNPRTTPKHANLEQLTFHGRYSPPDALANTLRLRYSDHKSELRELSRLFNVFFFEAERPKTFRDAAGVIHSPLAAWTVLNRLKHGLFVTLSDQAGAGVCVHTNPEDFEEYSEVRVRYDALVRIVALTFVGCLFLGRLLSLVYHSRYGAAPSVSWLAASSRVNLKRLDPYQMARVLRASTVPRRYDLLAAVSHQERAIEPVLFGELSANWWRGHPE